MQIRIGSAPPQSHYRKSNGYLVWVGILLLVVFVIIGVFVAKVVYDRQLAVIAAWEATKQVELEQEFISIAPLPNSAPGNYKSCKEG